MSSRVESVWAARLRTFGPWGAAGVTFWVLNTYPPSSPMWRYLAYWGLVPAVWFIAAIPWLRSKVSDKIIATVGCVVFIVGAIILYRYRPLPMDEPSVQSERGQSSEALQSYVKQGPQTKEEAEITRRQNIIKELRDEYVLSHNNVSSGLLEGTEFPPDDWLNRRLMDLGEAWRVSSSLPQEASNHSSSRSFLLFVGNPRFLPLAVGNKLFFNYYFAAPPTNPSLVKLVNPVHRWLYLTNDSTIPTQEGLLSDFHRRARESRESDKLLGNSYDTMVPGQVLWNDVTAAADNSEKDPRFITQKDLDALTRGSKVVFLFIEIPYTDYGKLHHLRTCTYISPPVNPPGIWHICGVTFPSD